MRLDFPRGDFFEVTLASACTANDMAFEVRAKRGAFAGENTAWIDQADVQRFVADLEKMANSSEGKAHLTSGDGQSLLLTLAPLDRLGHFVLTVALSLGLVLRAEHFESSMRGTFELETIEVLALFTFLQAELVCHQDDD